MADHQVLVTARSFGSGSVDVVRLLASTGIGIVRASGLHDPDELAQVLPTVQGWVTGRAAVTAELLDRAPGLRVLTRFGTDVDGIDVDAAVHRDVVVTSTPGADAESVADHAVGLLLAALRGVVDGDRRVRAGRWTTTRGRELRAVTVGLVGFGATGRALARRLAGFGPTLLVHESFAADGEPGPDVGPAVVVPHGRIVADCDLVVLLADGGVPIVDARWVATCREGQIVVNAGPPALVDEDDVAQGLRSGRLSVYAADGLAQPAAPAGPDAPSPPSPLLASDLAASVVVTPYLGDETLEAIDRKGLAAANDVIAVLSGRSPRHLLEPYEAPVDRFDRLARFAT